MAWNIPHLVGSLCAGDISFDKLRALADVATPETDREWCDQAKECSVRDLADVARSRRPTGSAALATSLRLGARTPSTIGASCASTTSTAR